MIKKAVLVLLLTSIFTGISFNVYALKAGDVTGKVYNTDIVAYINNYAVPSYAANGVSLIVAEDLRNFGFDVVWDGVERSLTITRNSNTTVSEMDFKKSNKPNSVFSNLLYSDVAVYAGDVKIPSYAINGYSMIPLESLTMFGEVFWIPEQRALKMWVDGLHIRSTMQEVIKEDSAEDFYVYNGLYEGGGVFIPRENAYIGLWTAVLDNVTSESMKVMFSVNESDYYVSMILYKQKDGSYYGVGNSSWGKSYITVWLISPQNISLTVSGAADTKGTEILRKNNSGM